MENLTKEIILDTLHNNRKIIRDLGVRKLILFGSYARDEQNENSDIDFLVEFDNKKNTFRNFYGLKHFLEDSFVKNIDLVESEYVRSELKPYILRGIQHEARV
jgi:predicted nucleotidyltransferase